ncbi:hypothetical protein GBF38_018462, partial [Nibea albiflora]
MDRRRDGKARGSWRKRLLAALPLTEPHIAPEGCAIVCNDVEAGVYLFALKNILPDFNRNLGMRQT